MPSLSWVQKFILGLLIFGVGGVSPLTYFTPLSPHRVPSYFISILETSAYGHFPSTLPAEIQEFLNQRRSSQGLTSYSASISPLNFAVGVSRSFDFNLSCGYLVPATQGFLPLFFLAQLAFTAFLSRPSAWLPPPDQPPRF